MKTRVAFLIRSLERGGAERQLAELVTRLNREYFEVLVLTFYPGGGIWTELQQHNGVEVRSLEKRHRWDIVRFFARFISVIRAWRPDVVHAFMIEPSLFALPSARVLSRSAVIWAIRASDVDFSRYDRLGWVTLRAAALLSRFADAIVANSEAGRTYHVSKGFDARRFTVIPNGIDTERFTPNPQVRQSRRKEWAIQEDVTVVGIVGRLDPMKDHPTFFAAAAEVIASRPNVQFVCVGGGSKTYSTELRVLVNRLSIEDHVRFVGESDDTTGIYPALDILCSSSAFGEGFSNAVAEAMACGLPTVVTAVGDSAIIVGDTGRIAPPSDPHALAVAITDLISLPPEQRAALGAAARRRIVERFSADSMVQQTARLYNSLMLDATTSV